MATSEATGTDGAAEECFALSVIYLSLSIFTLELGMGSIYSRKIIFHWWPSRDERADGEKGEGEDGMMTQLCKALVGSIWRTNRLEQKQVMWMQPKVRKGERGFECDVGVNGAAGAYTLHGRQRSVTACRFSEFIMNVLLFSSFSLTFLFCFTPFISLLSSFGASLPPSLSPLSQTRVAYHPGSKNKELYERRLVAFPPTPAVAMS